MMKKIIAGIAAAALAVSAMATSAFAAATEIVSVKTDAQTSYNSATVTFKSVALNADLEAGNTITLSGDTTALVNATAGPETIKINGFTGTGNVWTVVAAPALGDKTGVTEGDKALDLTVTYTFAETADISTIKTTLEGIFKADATEALTLTLGDGATGDVDLNFKDATIAFNAVTEDTTMNGVGTIMLDAANNWKGLSKTQKNAITGGEVTGAEIVIELKKAVEAEEGLKIKVFLQDADWGDVTDPKEVTIAKGETTGTITLTATEVIDVEFEDAYVHNVVIDNTNDVQKLIKSASYTIFGAEAEDTTAADETDVTEDTTAPEEGDADTGAFEAEFGAQFDSTTTDEWPSFADQKVSFDYDEEVTLTIDMGKKVKFGANYAALNTNVPYVEGMVADFVSISFDGVAAEMGAAFLNDEGIDGGLRLTICNLWNSDIVEQPLDLSTVGEFQVMEIKFKVANPAPEAEDTTAPEAEDTTAPEADDTTAEGDTGADAGEGEDGEAGKGENTETGVALAVIPAIVAGAALVASRKRK